MMRLALLFLLALTSHAAAQVPMVGAFVAEATCPATPSIRDPEGNPGNVATAAGTTYELVGRNAVPGSHYLILVPGAEPERRWVAYGCGRVEDGGPSGVVPASAPAAPAASSSQHGRPHSYVLAVSWQAAFCETRPSVVECRAGGRDDRGFALHGLWPQPRGREYCDIAPALESLDRQGDWLALPAPNLSRPTRQALEAAMPGVASGLERHEWIKHGTCFSGDAERYFAVSLRLLEELNGSMVRTLFDDAVGSDLTARSIRARFDRAFGQGAGERVLVDCAEVDGRRLLVELRISLAGTGDEPLARMVAEGERQPAGCGSGEVDPAGFS